jgi:hypothetical protein
MSDYRPLIWTADPAIHRLSVEIDGQNPFRCLPRDVWAIIVKKYLFYNSSPAVELLRLSLLSRNIRARFLSDKYYWQDEADGKKTVRLQLVERPRLSDSSFDFLRRHPLPFQSIDQVDLSNNPRLTVSSIYRILACCPLVQYVSFENCSGVEVEELPSSLGFLESPAAGSLKKLNIRNTGTVQKYTVSFTKTRYLLQTARAMMEAAETTNSILQRLSGNRTVLDLSPCRHCQHCLFEPPGTICQGCTVYKCIRCKFHQRCSLLDTVEQKAAFLRQYEEFIPP